METGKLICAWTDRCVGVDETPDGRIAVLAVRRGRSIRVEPASWPVEGAALAAGLTEREAWIRRIQTPLRDRAKALGVLPGLLDVQLPFGIEECVFECVGMTRQPAGWALTAAVAKENELRARLAHWTAEGVEPHHVDQESLALWTQAQEEHPLPKEALRAVVYLGLDRSLLVFGRGADLVSAHGLKRFEAAQALRLARLAFEGNAGEIQWLWGGPLAESAALVEGHVRELQAAGGALIMTNPRTVLARAYAIRALTAGPLRCDFRQGDRMHAGVRVGRERNARFSAIVWLAAGLILLMAGLAWRGLMTNRLARVDDDVYSRAVTLAAILDRKAVVPRGAERRTLERAWADQRSVLQSYSRAVAPGVSRGLSRLLMTAREERAVLHRLDWNGAGLKVEGRVPSPEAAERFKAAVEKETGLVLRLKLDPKVETDIPFALEGRDEL